MTTDIETVLTPADVDEGMHSHIVCPECHPDWVGKMGHPALCGEKLLGVPADGMNICEACKKLWFKHVRYVHMSFGERG